MLMGAQSGMQSDAPQGAVPGTPPLIVIVGETASGKSALAMELAERFNGELICADSWTVYRGFDIGTAKPSAADQARVPHHLLDVADPVTGFSAPQFQRLAGQAITDIASRMRLPILVGGTGLYVDSVLFNYGFLAPSDPQERARLEAMTLPELQLLIDKMGLDASGIDPRNKRRVIRFIENNGAEPSRHPLRENTLVLGMSVPRDELNARVAKRVDEMLAAGLESEVSALAGQYGWNVEPMKGIGYREWRAFFEPQIIAHDQKIVDNGKYSAQAPAEGGVEGTLHASADTLGQSPDPQNTPAVMSQNDLLSRQEVRERIIRGTMALAKKQRTWFKRNSSIQWVSDRSNAVDIVTTFLNKTI